MLNEALKQCLARDPGAPEGDSLAPIAAFDAVDPHGCHGEWLKAALLDGLVELSLFSTYFARGTPMQQLTLDRLEALKATGFMRAPMERRRQLLRVLVGLQPGPTPDPLLETLRADNLNPGLWGGVAPDG